MESIVFNLKYQCIAFIGLGKITTIHRNFLYQLFLVRPDAPLKSLILICFRYVLFNEIFTISVLIVNFQTPFFIFGNKISGWFEQLGENFEISHDEHIKLSDSIFNYTVNNY